MSEEEAGTLRQLVEAAGLPGVAARAATPGAQPRPDEFCYRLVVEDGGTRYTAEVRDSDMPDSVRPLIAWLMKQ